MSVISETMKKWADENEIALDEVQLEGLRTMQRYLLSGMKKSILQQ